MVICFGGVVSVQLVGFHDTSDCFLLAVQAFELRVAAKSSRICARTAHGLLDWKSSLPMVCNVRCFDYASLPSPPRTYYLGTGALNGPLRAYYLGTWAARA